MSSPEIILNDWAISQGQNSEVRYEGVKGLFEPAIVRRGATIETFDGPGKVRGQPTAFMPRQFSIAAQIIDKTTWLRNMEFSDALMKAIQSRPTKIQVGTLFLEAELEPVDFDKLTNNAAILGYSLKGEAVPALWQSLYGYAVGTAQSIIVVDDRPDNSSYKLTGAVGATWVSVTNPGTAPCYADVTVSGLSASTVYYMRNVSASTPDRVVFTTDATGAKRISPDMGLVLMPGANKIQIETSAGLILTMTTMPFGFHGTKFRYLGNAASASTAIAGGRFSEGPAVFSLFRTGAAASMTAAGTLTTVQDMAPRIGVPTGGWTAAKAGLVLEQAAKNWILQSANLSDAAWTAIGVPTFGAADATLLPDGATAYPVIDDQAGVLEGVSQTATAAAGDWWTASIYMKKGAGGSPYPGIRISYTGGAAIFAAAIVDDALGTVEVEDSGGVGKVSIESCGTGYWRVRVSLLANAGATAVLLSYYPAYSNNQLVSSVAMTGTKTAGGAQLEKLPIHTSYIATTTAAITRNADLCAVAKPHNYLQYATKLGTASSSTFQAPWVKVAGANLLANAAGSNGTTTAQTLNFAAAADSCYQIVTPDIQPSTSFWCFAVAMRKAAASPVTSFDLKIKTSVTGSATYADYSTTVATTTVLMSDFADTTSTRTYYVSGTPAATAASIMCEMIRNSGNGSVVIESCRLVRGYFPGLPLTTEGSNVPLPANGWEWPTWLTQNGYIQFSGVLPVISTGLLYRIFGDYSAAGPAIFRDSASTTAQNFLTITYLNNAGASSSEASINVGAIWDSALHIFKLEWLNYTLSGTQYMYLRLYIDGVLKSTSANLASATVTAWTAPAQFAASDGNTFATIRDLSIGVPSLPSGAIAAN